MQSAEVAILTAHQDKLLTSAALDDTLKYLERHGVKAQVHSVEIGSHGIGRALQEAAMSSDAGLLVMGGYGHSRLREFVLGGATAGVLQDPILPIFFSR